MTSTRYGGGLITQLRFDYAITLLTDTDLMIHIQCPFNFTTSRGVDLLIDPEHVQGRGCGDLLLEMFNKTIDDLSYSPGGELRISISDAIEIVVGSDPDYEPWVISGPGTALVVSKPGGGVAVWPDRSNTQPTPPSD